MKARREHWILWCWSLRHLSAYMSTHQQKITLQMVVSHHVEVLFKKRSNPVIQEAEAERWLHPGVPGQQ